MKYVALLRGINVGGNAIIKMADLKNAFETMGFTSVRTYINSGNVLFESPEKSSAKIAKSLENVLSKIFHLDLRVVLLSEDQMKKVVVGFPEEWKSNTGLRQYVAFVREPVTENEVLDEIEIKEGVDSVKTGKGVVYMSTKKEGLMKSSFTKLISKKIYKEITMRNSNTVRKLLALMANQ